MRYELQADCLTGATLQGMVNDKTLIFEAGDNQEITNGPTNVAGKTSWGRKVITARRGADRELQQGRLQRCTQLVGCQFANRS
ncbi:hypothetical protein [Phytohabitans houttuyneae]|uniref:Uncharacterized protein n=1 Tax=Phytohabitans houttuyneae TaxID=1076126 RepID=A0A6V8KR02_9ACTN|nr:hypothetical protein [Phytohabitans houttuyneae]GFJ85830.1 hypothetical protein Phou_100100 [Phytohabitans houttuyneae]